MTCGKGTFEGMWGDGPSAEMSKTAQALATESVEKEARVKRRSDRAPFGVGSIILAGLIFLGVSLLMTIAYVGITGTTDQAKLVSDPTYLILSMLSMHVSWIGSAWLLSRQGSFKRFADAISLRIKWRDIPIGLGYAAAFFVIAAGMSFFLTEVLKLDISAAENTSSFTQFSGIWLFLIAGIMVPIVGPLAEEIFFRGFIQTGLQNSLKQIVPAKFTVIPALLVTSFVFGMMHFQPESGDMWWVTVLVTGMLGLVMGIIAIAHKRLGPAIFAHMFYNAVAITLAVTGGA